MNYSKSAPLICIKGARVLTIKPKTPGHCSLTTFLPSHHVYAQKPDNIDRFGSCSLRYCPLFLMQIIETNASPAAVTNIVPPSQQGVLDQPQELPEPPFTDVDTIVATVEIVDQKTGPLVDEPPNQPVPETVITAVDGQITEAGADPTLRVTTEATPSRRSVERRAISDYQQVFDGTGLRADSSRDASIQGTAYLTFTIVNNATYNIADCLNFCSSVPQCGASFHVGRLLFGHDTDPRFSFSQSSPTFTTNSTTTGLTSRLGRSRISSVRSTPMCTLLLRRPTSAISNPIPSPHL
jgi:hypothetical protein